MGSIGSFTTVNCPLTGGSGVADGPQSTFLNTASFATHSEDEIVVARRHQRAPGDLQPWRSFRLPTKQPAPSVSLVRAGGPIWCQVLQVNQCKRGFASRGQRVILLRIGSL